MKNIKMMKKCLIDDYHTLHILQLLCTLCKILGCMIAGVLLQLITVICSQYNGRLKLSFFMAFKLLSQVRLNMKLLSARISSQKQLFFRGKLVQALTIMQCACLKNDVSKGFLSSMFTNLVEIFHAIRDIFQLLIFLNAKLQKNPLLCSIFKS